MHKTLYIDIDEEITSVIDRVRKAEAKEVIIVAPKNSTLLQSIVNLKLLKKEADRRKKQLLIITQDKVGKKLIEKAGILAQAKAGSDLFLGSDPEEKPYEPKYADEALEIKEELQKEENQKEIGSAEYFDEKPAQKEEAAEDDLAGKATAKSVKSVRGGAPVAKKSEKTTKKNGAKARVNMSDIVTSQPKPPEKKSEQEPAEEIPEKEIVVSELDQFSASYAEMNAEPSKISQVSIKKAEKFFRGARRTKKDLEIARVGGGAKKYFIFFATVFGLGAALAAAYFFLPKATLALQVANQEKSVSFELTADVESAAVSASEKKLPAYFEEVVEEATKEFSSSGSKEGGAKASGRAVIYNEFSPEEQTLVATTRLEMEDGKIFRITKNTTVPGVIKDGEETKPGAIEVEVSADQAGEEYNIGPASFKIPGFKGTPEKYEKFSAKSVKPMTGGSAGSAKLVTAQDIASAKEKIASEGKKIAVEKFKNSLPPDRKIFDDSVQVEVLGVSVSESVGAEKEKFSSTAKIRAGVLSFKEDDVKSILRQNLAEAGENAGDILLDDPINYILSESNIQQKTLKFRAKTDAKTAAGGLDLANFKKGLLGKTVADAQTYAKSFPAIQKMDITFWPFFATRIPMNERRVVVEVE